MRSVIEKVKIQGERWFSSTKIGMYPKNEK